MKDHNNTTVKSEGEKKSWFGRIKDKFYGTVENQEPVAKRKYTQATDNQILEMLRLRKENPNLSHCKIAKLVDVSDAVAHYWLVLHTEKQVRKILKARKARRKAQYKKPTKSTKKVKKQKKKTEFEEATQAPETDKEEEFTLSNNLDEMSLSTFTKLSEQKGKQILAQIKKEEKHPVDSLADPEKFQGAIPSQVVASPEEFKEQKRKNQISRAVQSDVMKQNEENKKEEARKVRLRKKHEKNKPKNHIDHLCPSCNPKSTLTTKQYDQIQYQLFQEQRDYAMQKQKELNRKEKQLEKREQTVIEMEKEALGNVAELAKQGHKLCEVCDRPIEYLQAKRSSSEFNGHYYCSDHEPKI